MGDIRLFSYKMTHDDGFAPNPFHGFLTLANCKPGIRRTKKEGDWIAGFTSKTLNKDEVGHERLVYLMQVSKSVTYDVYWNSPEYERKKPNVKSGDKLNWKGDNIYEPIEHSQEGVLYQGIRYAWRGIKHHNDASEWEHDLKGEKVLISNKFFYFGNNPLKITDEIRPHIHIPKGATLYGYKTEGKQVELFIDFVKSNRSRIQNPDFQKWNVESTSCG